MRWGDSPPGFVRNAAKKMVAGAAECQPHTHATSEYPLSQKQDELVFYLLTDAGTFTASASKEDLNDYHHPLSKLHDAAQRIITEYRLIQGNK